MKNRKLDTLNIGRSSVDLYGNQVGGRLEDIASFANLQSFAANAELIADQT